MNQRIKIVRALFEERLNEVASHLKFIQVMVHNKSNRLARVAPDGDAQIIDYEIRRETIKALIASGFLHIYNLIESTMTNTLDSIHNQCSIENVNFEQLNNQLKKICIKNFKKVSTIDISVCEHPIATAMVNLGYEKKYLFSGNIHANIIKDKAKEYGFTIADHDQSISRNGARLELIMKHRNDLAHGNISFQQCGGDASIDELIEMLNESSAYLTAVIDGVEDYINNKSYLAA